MLSAAWMTQMSRLLDEALELEGRRPAEAQRVLVALEGDQGDRAAYQYAQIYARWGHTSRALDWIERAYERRDGDLANLKVDYLLDPLREEPRFQAIERKLNFPN
jgi:hypothetical protein